jgi:pyridoxal phosphate-dependent aminotransferase EpsN
MPVDGVVARIYLSPPHMSGHELELVNDAFASNWIAPLGPHVDALVSRIRLVREVSV